MEQMELDFIGKKKSCNRGGADVSVTLACKGTTREQTSFVFRNDSMQKIAPNTNCYVLAVHENRLYFKEATAHDGFKTYKNGGTNSYTTLHAETVTNWARIHEGDYSLQYDSNNKLYFIEDSRQWITKGGRAG